jgi:ABC-type lipoprotein release transport system permease subunit
MTFAMAAGAVLGVAAIATLVPALRIARLNPIRALRM